MSLTSSTCYSPISQPCPIFWPTTQLNLSHPSTPCPPHVVRCSLVLPTVTRLRLTRLDLRLTLHARPLLAPPPPLSLCRAYLRCSALRGCLTVVLPSSPLAPPVDLLPSICPPTVSLMRPTAGTRRSKQIRGLVDDE